MVKETKIYTTSDGKDYKTKKAAERHENEITLTSLGYSVFQVDKYLKEIAKTNAVVNSLLENKKDWRDWSSHLVKQIPSQIEDYKENTVVYMIIKRSLWGRNLETKLSVKHKKLEDGKYPDKLNKYLKDLTDKNTEGSTFGLKLYKEEGNKLMFEVKEHKLTPEEKMARGLKLNDNDIRELVFERDEVYEEKGENRRWSRSVLTVVKALDGNTYAIEWEEGLTESQEHEFYEQPKKAKVEKEEVVTVVTKVVYLPEDESSSDSGDNDGGSPDF